MEICKEWTSQNYGVTHLKTSERMTHATVTDYDVFAKAVIFLSGHKPFFNGWKVAKFLTVDEAKCWSENQLKILSGVQE